MIALFHDAFMLRDITLIAAAIMICRFIDAAAALPDITMLFAPCC